MIHLYTGEGKGKTTAATGLSVRAAGSGMNVLFTQFMKGNDSGELHSLSAIPKIRICRSRKQFGFYRTLTEEQKEQLKAEHNWILDEILKAMENGECDLVVLDEITYAVNWGLLDVDKLQKILSVGGREIEIVLTGRRAQPFLVDAADYITEMRAVRHPFEKGIAARKGIEF